MSRETCSHCGNSFSTTGSPNSMEGYFIDDVTVEKLDFELDKKDFHLMSFLKNNCSRTMKCPDETCGKITIM